MSIQRKLQREQKRTERDCEQRGKTYLQAARHVHPKVAKKLRRQAEQRRLDRMHFGPAETVNLGSVTVTGVGP